MVLLPYNGINRLTGYCFFLCWYLAYCLPCLQFAFTMYMLIYSVCERMLAERSYCFIQVCSSVENMSICTIDSSDLNWKLLRSMHILRVLVVHFFLFIVCYFAMCTSTNSMLFLSCTLRNACVSAGDRCAFFCCCCLFKFCAFDCIRLPSTLSIYSHTQGLSDLKFIWKWSVKTIHEYGSTNWWVGCVIQIYSIGRCFMWTKKRRLKSEIISNYHAQLNGLIGMRIDFIGNFEIRIS